MTLNCISYTQKEPSFFPRVPTLNSKVVSCYYHAHFSDKETAIQKIERLPWLNARDLGRQRVDFQWAPSGSEETLKVDELIGSPLK